MVDLEVQLALDESESEANLRTRDRGIYLALREPPADSDALLSRWLGALRDAFGKPDAGARTAAALRILSVVLLLTGLASGWGVTELLLHFEQGGAPVNIGYVLLVLVFGQLATLLLLALGLLLRRYASAVPVLGDLTRLLRFIAERIAAALRERPPAHEIEAARRAAYHRMRTRVGLYDRLERALLLSQTQLFALAFNVGALCSCLRLILLSDLAFAWSTSVGSLDAATVQRVCSLLSLPFAWLLPDALPSRELIEHTQYFRLEGRFANAPPGSRGDPALAGEWWRFLVACVVTYGLLPRVFTYGWFAARFRRAERELPLDTPAVQRVLARLRTPDVSTRAEGALLQAAEPARPAARDAERSSAASELVLYRDVPTDSAMLARALGRHLGLSVGAVHRAGGVDAASELALCRTLAAKGAPVVLVAEAWEAPDKSLRQLLARLRAELGARVTLRVVLIGEASAHGFREPASSDVAVYRDRLTLLEDPYLSIETLPSSSALALEEEQP